MLIETVVAVTPEIISAVTRLVPQLTNKRPPTEAELEALVASGCSSLVIARQGQAGSAILGMACVSLYRVPTGVRPSSRM